MSISLTKSKDFLESGDTVVYTVSVANNAPNVCAITCATVSFQCPGPDGQPNGVPIVLATGLDLAAGTDPITIGSVTCTVTTALGVLTATARADVDGVVHDLTVPGCTEGNATCVTNDCDPDVGGGMQTVSVAVRHPCIEVTKNCQNATGEGGAIGFNGTITNCGDETIVDVALVDDNGTPGNPADDVMIVSNQTLSVGGSLNYSGSYIPATCGPTTNTVFVTGTGLVTGSTVQDSDDAICETVINPCLSITKVCQNATAQGGDITFNGTVSNCGNVTIEGVTVWDIVDGVTNQVVVIGSVAPQASATYSGSYTPTTCPSTDRVFATGNTPANCGNGQAVTSNTAEATCGEPGTPGIDVTKQCSLTGDCDSPSIAFNGTVTNTGDLDLNNVTVVDDNGTPGNQADDVVVFGPASLAVGASATFGGTYTAVNNPSTNTVVASGISAGQPSCGGGSNVTDMASCTVPITGQPCISVTKSCDFGDSARTNVVFNGTVTNCGDMTLVDITVVDDNGTAGDTSDDVTVLGPITLASGASATYSGSYGPIAGPGSYTDVVVATGYDRTICASSAPNSERQVTDTANCTVTIEPEGSCRVTGGGRQERNKTNPEVRYVTHGGQVGAPHSVPTAFTPDSQCIRGQWQHVRHIKAGLKGNFHSDTFDSLMCACLGCEENPGAGVIVGGLCNPDDRICGPEPRRAPANKICFSGVGDYVKTRGKKKRRSVVFRVDIEDRSEPGGSKPGGQTPPPDRYRIRLWFLDGNEGDAMSDAAMALRQSVACSSPLTEDVDARSPDIDDGGELDRGNHQLHPSTGSVCNPE